MLASLMTMIIAAAQRPEPDPLAPLAARFERMAPDGTALPGTVPPP
jgi:hypothetical protein